MREFFNKSDIIAQPKITIAVTDSGLGGLSTTADLMRRLRGNCPFSQVRVVFFNALFDNASGYNRLDLASEKIRIFDAALSSLQARFSP
ncbi:hypothetical protein KAH55_13575, partial [bacterium]|nr:hypothetical protein [bacterium]